jgi:hypothetical protein
MTIHVNDGLRDLYRPPDAPPGWEVDLSPEMGSPLPDDRVRIRQGRQAAVPGRVYAVNYATNKMYVELDEEGAD